METINSISMQDLSMEELMIITGGSAYSAGYTLGKSFVKAAAIYGVLVLFLL